MLKNPTVKTVGYNLPPFQGLKKQYHFNCHIFSDISKNLGFTPKIPEI